MSRVVDIVLYRRRRAARQFIRSNVPAKDCGLMPAPGGAFEWGAVPRVHRQGIGGHRLVQEGVRTVKKSRMTTKKKPAAQPANIDPTKHTVFSTGAYRDSDKDKIDFEGHLSPLALDVLGRYMHKHRFLRDGSVRASDDWQLGFDDASFVKPGMRHFMAVWRIMRGWPAEESLEDAFGGWLFNANGLAHQLEKRRIEAAGKRDADTASARPAA